MDGEDLAAEIVGVLVSALKAKKTKDHDRILAAQALWQVIITYPDIAPAAAP